MLNVDDLIKESMKSRNQTELRAYKNLKAEIQAFKTAKNAKPYDEVAEISIIKKYCEKLEKSILSFSEAHREDLVSEYSDELEVLRKLLPEPVNASDIYSFIESDEEFFAQYYITKFIGDNDETVMLQQIPKKDMGKAIKYLKSKFPTADGKLISEIVKKYL